MKKTFMGMLVAALVLFASAPVLHAAANPYVSASGGVAFLTDSDADFGGGTVEDAIEYKTGYKANGAFGLDGGMYRVEVAVGYQVNDVDKVLGGSVNDVDVSILSFMGNGYVDFDMPTAPVEPYVMAGAGYAVVEVDGPGGSEDDGAFAYQFGAGVAFDAAPKVVLDLGYRYFATADVFNEDISIASHNILAGVRINL